MPRKRKLLLLGGTGEALRLARELEGNSRVHCISSLAGRTEEPVRPPGEVRIGGFGGVPGLTTYLMNEAIEMVLDATHPFASQIARNAHDACLKLGIPRAKLVRPPWSPSPGDRWTIMPSISAAATFLRFHPARRIFLTLGRQELGPFVPLGEEGERNGSARWFLTRMIDPPGDGIRLPRGEIVLGRGPFQPEEEKALMQKHQIDMLVTKNSGGAAGKIAAAAELHLPVLMIDRPPLPPGEILDSVGAALAWINIYAV
ncbi:cobalt-precorrin-6A reductase [uncultured Ferrovibrio sp.]|jgi:precorrin-6A/cobalt-precorrin-6A reductase|uniref:cobalt-precorrin-6A reductase n=1 Tax=uncultured Ferrovibrio sp. TaxID=1576913 RepID=UPI002612A7B0|nr:cobalt-precorrin-6A reductase [uncultured Ferrovibrio sp.]